MYDVERIKRDHPVYAVVGKYMKLIRRGDEWWGLCPFHKERTPSFVAHPVSYYCFGCGAKGDVIAFMMDVAQVNFTKACEMLDAEEVVAQPTPVSIPRNEAYATLRSVPPTIVPTAGKPFRFFNPKRQRWSTHEPTMVFEYWSADGKLLGIVIRIELADGKKVTPTCRMSQHGWTYWSFDEPRPLYGLNLLAKSEGWALWVEGEKAADAGRRMLHIPVITNPGGGNAAHMADWAPLAGRKLLVIGDADAPGEKTASAVARHAHVAGAATVCLVPWDHSKPEGWDLADAERDGWGTEEVRIWLTEILSTTSSQGRLVLPFGVVEWESLPREEAVSSSAR